MPNQHLIGDALFDISFGSENDAFEQSADLGSLMQHTLLPVVDEVFTEYSATEEPLRIDRLEIDLGTVPYDGFQDALKQRLREQLDRLLRERLPSRKTGPIHGSDRAGMRRAECDALEYFLLHGHMPQRTGLDPDRIFDQWLQRVLRHDGARLVTFLRHVAQRHTVVSRLVRQCRDATLLTIAQQLVSFNVHMLSRFIEHLRTIMARAHRSPYAETEIRHVIWEQIIIESLANQHMPLDLKSLVSRVVTHASRRQGQTTLMTLTHLASTATQYETSAEPGLTLVSLLNQLIAEEDQADIAADTLRRPDEGTHDNTRLRRRAEAAFETGHPEELLAIWPELVRDHAEMLATLLRHYGVHARLRQQLVRACPEIMLRDFVRVIEPHDHLMIHAIMDTLTRWQAYDIVDRSTLTHRLWTGTLAYLLVERGPHFNPPAYLRRLLWHLAAHAPQHYQALLRSLITTTADTLPGGLPADLAGHLEALAIDKEPADALAASAAQRAALVHAYTLYDTLTTTLRDDSMPPATTTDDLAGIIETLTRDHPWQLLRLYRELQTGTIASATLTARFSPAALYQLLAALLTLTQQTTDETSSDLHQAINRYAKRAHDRHYYYGQILDALIHNTVIDFEALIAENRAAADTKDPAQKTAQDVLAEPSTSPLAASFNLVSPDEAETLVMTALMTTSPLSAAANTRFQQAISLLVTHHPTRLRALLDTALLHQTAATQLVKALPEPVLTTLLALLRPAEYIPIQRAAESIMTASAAAHLLSPPDKVRDLTWQFIWHYLMEEGRAFDPHEFVARLTASLTAHTPTRSVQDVRARLSQQLALDSLPSTLDHHRTLLSTLGEIASHPLRTDTDTESSDTSVTAHEPGFTNTPATTMETSEDSARLRRRVEAAFDAERPEDLIAIWPELVRDHAGMLATLLRHYGVHARFRRQLARTFPKAMLHDIVRVLEPRDHAVIHTIIDAVAQGPSPDMTSFADHDTLTHRLWTGTLTMLLERGSHFAPQAYLRCLLWHLAAHEPHRYQAWLRSLITTTADALPGGLPPDLAVHLAALASDAEEEENRLASTKQPAPLVQAYVLYDTLIAYLRDGGQPAATPAENMAAIIDTLARDHPWQLLRLYRELQTGTIASATLTVRFAPATLYRLLKALIALTQQTQDETSSELLLAIDRYAEHARDRQHYYRQILDALIHNTVIDFEALVVAERRAAADTPTPLASPEDTTPETAQGALAEPSTTPLVASFNLVSSDEAETLVTTALTTTSPLSAEASTQFHQAISLLGTHHPTRLRALLDTALLHRTAATRLVEALPEPVLTELLALLRPVAHVPIQRMAESIMTAGAGAHLVAPPGRVRRLTWQFIFQYLFEEGHVFDHRDFVAHLTDSLTAHTPTRSVQDFRARLSEQLAIDSLPSTLDLHRTLLTSLAEITDGKLSPRGEQVPHQPIAQTDRFIAPEEDTTEEVYIANAGQVLAAPYLPRLFAMLNLTEDSAFINPEAAERAVHLLQFMVNEQTDSPEYQLILNKIMCGVKTGVPITREITITDRERDAINGLIQGMIQNWKAIGNTSITGFRESFLQRNGRLKLENNAWHLVVEPRAFDMLIDQIPWSFSLVKHRWMNHPIHVKWR